MQLHLWIEISQLLSRLYDRGDVWNDQLNKLSIFYDPMIHACKDKSMGHISHIWALSRLVSNSNSLPNMWDISVCRDPKNSAGIWIVIEIHILFILIKYAIGNGTKIKKSLKSRMIQKGTG